MTTKQTPTPRDGEKLDWIVVNPEGKLLAILDSESEAHFFCKNRGHATDAVYFKAPIDYSTAPALASRAALCDELAQALQNFATMDRAKMANEAANIKHRKFMDEFPEYTGWAKQARAILAKYAAAKGE